MGFYKLTSSVAEQYVNAFIQDKTYKVNKVGIGVIKNSSAGTIEVTIIEGGTGAEILKQTVDLNNLSEAQEVLWFDVTSAVSITAIKIVNKTGTNAVTGIYLIEDMNQPVINNYSRSGAKIEDLSDGLIDKLFNTNAIVFALGHNSTASAIDSYLAKCVTAYNTYKPMVYVLDLTWTDARLDTANKLKQFAKDCNGLYIEVIPRVSDANELITSGFLSDVSHPTVFGHKEIAEKFLSAAKAPITSKRLITNYIETTNNAPIIKTITMGAGFTLAGGSWTKIGKINFVALDITGTGLATGNTLCTLDKSVVTTNLTGTLWGTASGNVICPCTHGATTGSLVIYPTGGVSGNRFTISYSYYSA